MNRSHRAAILSCSRSCVGQVRARGVRRTIALLGVGVAVGMVAPPTGAQVYNWAPWTSTGPQSAAASEAAMGTVTVVVSESGTNATTPFPVRFDGVDFTPVDAPSVGIGNSITQSWSLSIDFTDVPDTVGVILGIGNFGHGTPSLPGYRLAAFDKFGVPMPLTALEQIGSYDHTWSAFGLPFNDDVTLLTGSGDFTVTAVAGMNENNSDILLMSLPAGVGRLVVSTVGPTGGDTLNVLIAPTTPRPCRADVNGSGTLTVQDIFDFLAFYFAAPPDPRGDFNGSGLPATVQDIFDFLAAYFAGCT